MTPKQISEKLSNRVIDVCQELLPEGKKDGHEWKVGSVEGEPGKSMGVHLAGDKAGVWADFATGESGDLLDLWCAARSIPLSEAIEEAKGFLGIHETKFYRAKPKSFSRPAKPQCSASSIEMDWLRSRGLTDQTLKQFQVGGKEGKVYFPFLRGGELIMCKLRDIRSKETRPTSSGQEPCLFGWQAIPSNTREVYITEGEIDAMSMAQMGYPALSVPFGGGKGAKQQWIENEFDNLERFDQIFLAMDSDEVGKEGAKEIIERLGRHRCRYVNLPAKDANECLQNGLQSLVKKAVDRAVALDPCELRSASGFADDIYYELYPEEKPDKDEYVALLGNKHCEDFVFRPSEMIGVCGINGHGKSQWLGQLAIESMSQGVKWCVASMELEPKKLLARKTRQVSGMAKPTREYINAIDEWYDGKLWLFNVVGNAKTSRILEVFEYAHRRYGVNHFIIDSLMMCGIADDDYAGQKDFLLKIRDFKSLFPVTVFIVMHPRKGLTEEQAPGKFDVLGGIAITNLLDSGLTIWRNKKKEQIIQGSITTDKSQEEINGMPDCKAVIWKQRNGEGWEGSAYYWFNPQAMQYRSGSTYKPKHYVNYTKLKVTA